MMVDGGLYDGGKSRIAVVVVTLVNAKEVADVASQRSIARDHRARCDRRTAPPRSGGFPAGRGGAEGACGHAGRGHAGVGGAAFGAGALVRRFGRALLLSCEPLGYAGRCGLLLSQSGAGGKLG